MPRWLRRRIDILQIKRAHRKADRQLGEWLAMNRELELEDSLSRVEVPYYIHPTARTLRTDDDE